MKNLKQIARENLRLFLQPLPSFIQQFSVLHFLPFDWQCDICVGVEWKIFTVSRFDDFVEGGRGGASLPLPDQGFVGIDPAGIYGHGDVEEVSFALLNTVLIVYSSWTSRGI